MCMGREREKGVTHECFIFQWTKYIKTLHNRATGRDYVKHFIVCLHSRNYLKYDFIHFKIQPIALR